MHVQGLELVLLRQTFDALKCLYLLGKYVLARHRMSVGHVVAYNPAESNADVPQVLCAIVGADERTYPNLTPMQLAWLADTRLMTGLLGQIGPEAEPDAQKNAASVLTAIARSQLAGPLAWFFIAPEFCDELLRHAFVPTVSIQACASPVCFLSKQVLPDVMLR